MSNFDFTSKHTLDSSSQPPRALTDFLFPFFSFFFLKTQTMSDCNTTPKAKKNRLCESFPISQPTAFRQSVTPSRMLENLRCFPPSTQNGPAGNIVAAAAEPLAESVADGGATVGDCASTLSGPAAGAADPAPPHGVDSRDRTAGAGWDLLAADMAVLDHLTDAATAEQTSLAHFAQVVFLPTRPHAQNTHTCILIDTQLENCINVDRYEHEIRSAGS
jgi:hypothetical protein